MKIKNVLFTVAALLAVNTLQAQMVLTMDDAIDISIQSSPDLLTAELQLERSEKLLSAQRASLKTQFKLSVDPIDYSNDRSMDTFLSEWYTNESFSSMGTFSISQPIVWTGATISLNNRFGWQSNTSSIDSGSINTSQSFSNSLYLSLDQPLFTYNDTKYELLTIEMDYENQRISYAMTRLSLEQQIISRFYSVYMAQENLVVAQEEMDNAQQSYDIINEKVRLDMVPRSELFQAEINLSDAESTLITREVSLETAKDNLKQLLGLPLSTEFSVDAEISENPVTIDIDMAKEHALTNRLELKQREITNKNAEITLLQIKDNNSFQGELSLSVGIMGDNPAFDNIYTTPTSSPSVNLSFSIPIFDWGARKDRINAQKLQIDINGIDEEQELIDIELEVLTSYRSLNSYIKQIEIAKKSVDNAQQTYDLNVENYRAGEITGMEMNEFQTQLSSQKISLAQAMVDYKMELINLKCVTLYDFEKSEPIAPLLMYSSEAVEKVQEYTEKINKR
ncbi:MAG: TolC family protein [Rikenellaceae bacterium]